MESKILVEEELKRINASQLSAAITNTSQTLQALGIIEAVCGLVAMLSPAFYRLSSVFGGDSFVFLLGVSILVSGIVNIVASVADSSFGQLSLGIISALAGLLIMAHPLFGLSILMGLISVYLIAAGVTRFFGPTVDAISNFNAIYGVVLGIIALFAVTPANNIILGIIIGVSLLLNGGYITNFSLEMRRPIREKQA